MREVQAPASTLAVGDASCAAGCGAAPPLVQPEQVSASHQPAVQKIRSISRSPQHLACQGNTCDFARIGVRRRAIVCRTMIGIASRGPGRLPGGRPSRTAVRRSNALPGRGGARCSLVWRDTRPPGSRPLSSGHDHRRSSGSPESRRFPRASLVPHGTSIRRSAASSCRAESGPGARPLRAAEALRDRCSPGK